MANWFDRIKKYYDAGLWTKKMVGNAVVKKKITAEQYGNHRRGLQQVRITVRIFFFFDPAEARKDNIMYPNNIYIKHYAENCAEDHAGDIGVQLDKFDNDHHITTSSTTRWPAPSTSTGAACRPVSRSC